jgi:putative hydrolase of HD superfamily
VTPARLDRQLTFLDEADRLKSVHRATTLNDASRRENSAEHSWHIALYALTLAEHAPPGVSIDRVIRMLLLHDIVEIDTGDTPIHSQNGTAHGSADLAVAEEQAAARIFGLLPPDQAAAFRALWTEFEAAQTPDAIFAKSIDRVQPVMANLASGGGTWTEYAVTRDQLESRVGAKVARGAPAVWAGLKARLDAWFGPTT